MQSAHTAVVRLFRSIPPLCGKLVAQSYRGMFFSRAKADTLPRCDEGCPRFKQAFADTMHDICNGVFCLSRSGSRGSNSYRVRSRKGSRSCMTDVTVRQMLGLRRGRSTADAIAGNIPGGGHQPTEYGCHVWTLEHCIAPAVLQRMDIGRHCTDLAIDDHAANSERSRRTTPILCLPETTRKRLLVSHVEQQNMCSSCHEEVAGIFPGYT